MERIEAEIKVFLFCDVTSRDQIVLQLYEWEPLTVSRDPVKFSWQQVS